MTEMPLNTSLLVVYIELLCISKHIQSFAKRHLALSFEQLSLHCIIIEISKLIFKTTLEIKIFIIFKNFIKLYIKNSSILNINKSSPLWCLNKFIQLLASLSTPLQYVQTHLSVFVESNVSSLFSETLTAQVQTVFSDQTRVGGTVTTLSWTFTKVSWVWEPNVFVCHDLLKKMMLVYDISRRKENNNIDIGS